MSINYATKITIYEKFISNEVHVCVLPHFHEFIINSTVKQNIWNILRLNQWSPRNWPSDHFEGQIRSFNVQWIFWWIRCLNICMGVDSIYFWMLNGLKLHKLYAIVSYNLPYLHANHNYLHNISDFHANHNYLHNISDFHANISKYMQITL